MRHSFDPLLAIWRGPADRPVSWHVTITSNQNRRTTGLALDDGKSSGSNLDKSECALRPNKSLSPASLPDHFLPPRRDRAYPSKREDPEIIETAPTTPGSPAATIYRENQSPSRLTSFTS